MKDLVENGNRISKKWYLWCVVDVVESMVITIIWRPTSKRTNTTRMECLMCRTDTSRKCRHELICEAECGIETYVSGSEYSDDGTDRGGDNRDSSMEVDDEEHRSSPVILDDESVVEQPTVGAGPEVGSKGAAGNTGRSSFFRIAQQ